MIIIITYRVEPRFSGFINKTKQNEIEKKIYLSLLFLIFYRPISYCHAIVILKYSSAVLCEYNVRDHHQYI